MDRWRKPVIPVAVEGAPGKYSGDGHGWRQQVNWTLTPEDYGRIKQGYVCINCMEPHETPYPENCVVCRFPMRKEQARMTEYEFEGEKHIGPSTSLQEEADRLADWADRKDHQPGSRIWVPGSAKT